MVSGSATARVQEGRFSLAAAAKGAPCSPSKDMSKDVVGRSVFRGRYLLIMLITAPAVVLRMSTPARIVPKAVDRNKIKRWIREARRYSALRDRSIEVRLHNTKDISLKTVADDMREAAQALLKNG